jgi:hypothetical protein
LQKTRGHGGTLYIACQIASLYLFVESIAVVAGCVVVGAFVAAQIIIFTTRPIFVDVVVIYFISAFRCEGAQWRVVKVARIFTVVANATLDHLIALALFRLGREQLWIRTHEFPKLTIHTLVVAATARRL